MAEAIGIASGVGQLLTIAVEITRFSYGYINDVIKASRTQKAYIGEVSALTEVLLRLDQSLQDSETLGTLQSRSAALSGRVILECCEELTTQRLTLEKHVNRCVWPFQEKELRKSTEAIHRFRGIFADYATANLLSISSATLRSVECLKQDRDRACLLGWLDSSDKSLPRSHVPALAGTGSWFLNHSHFRDWSDNSASILWCHGPPGVGKSVLALLAIDHLTTKHSDTSYVVQHFCDFTDGENQTESAIMFNIIRQVILHNHQDAIPILMKSYNGSATSPKLKDLVAAFCQTCRSRQTYLVFDALDELRHPGKMIALIKSFVDAGCKLLVLSRDHPDIKKAFTSTREIQARTTNDDLACYVRHRFSESDFCHMVDECNGIVDAIIDKAGGLFLLAQLLMDQLLEMPNFKKMRNSLRDFPTTLNKAFESSLRRIDSQPTALREMAHRTIGWIVRAGRPLGTLELIHAFAVEPEENVVDLQNLTTVPTLLRICAGMMVLDQNDSTLKMVHFTAFQFFYNRQEHNILLEQDIARTCLLYLCLQPLLDGPCQSRKDMSTRLGALPFLKYAACNWGKFAKSPEVEQHLGDLIDKLLNHSQLRSASVQALHYREIVKFQDVAHSLFETLPKDQSRLHVAAYWGLQTTTMKYLTDSDTTSYPDFQGWTPLHWAASNGHHEVMKILLNHDAAVDSADFQGWTPLFWAGFNGNLDAIQLLLDKNSNYLQRDVHGWTVLHWTVSSGHKNAVELLLHHHNKMRSVDGTQGTRLNLSDESDRASDYPDKTSLLEVAADALEVDTFDVLIKDIHSENNSSVNTIWSASHFDPPMSNIWRVINKAERSGGIISFIDDFNRFGGKSRQGHNGWKERLLYSAIRDQKLSVVKLLLELGANINCNRRRTPLHAATFRKDPQFVQVLLDHGADSSQEDIHSQTALHQAVLNGFEMVIETLLRAGADVNARRGLSQEYIASMTRSLQLDQTPLMLACGYKIQSPDDRKLQTRICELLLLYGANVLLEDDIGQTCAHYAAMSGNVDVARGVLDMGDNANARDKRSISVLHHAAKTCNVDLVRLLIERGADPNLIDKYGRSAIHFMAAGNDDKIPMDHLETIFAMLYASENPKLLNHEYDAAKATRYRPNARLDYHTPMSQAIEAGNWKVFEILRRSDAALPRSFEPLLDDAIGAMNVDRVRFLISAGAKISRYPDSSHTGRGKSANPARALCRALSSSTNEADLDSILKALIDIRFDINDGSILEHAAISVDSAAIAQILIRNGADPYRTENAFDAFILAAIQGNHQFLHGLLGLSLSSAPSGRPAYESKQFSGTMQTDLERLCVALQDSGQIDMVDENGQTILSRCAQNDSRDFLRCLLAHGADTESADTYGWTALHYATVNGHQSSFSIILDAATNIDARTKSWAISETPQPSGLYRCDPWMGTALHLAAIIGHVEIATILIERGADFKISTDSTAEAQLSRGGRGTALDIARDPTQVYGLKSPDLYIRRQEIAKLLTNKGA